MTVDEESVRAQEEEDQRDEVTDFAARYWFLMEFTNAAVRLVETEEDEEGIADAIRDGECILVHRIVHEMIQGETHGGGVRFGVAHIPYKAVCPPAMMTSEDYPMRLNAAQILSFQAVDESCDDWSAIKRDILHDTQIVLPASITVPGVAGASA